MYEEQIKNDDPEIYAEYLTHDTSFLLPQHLLPCADYSISV